MKQAFLLVLCFFTFLTFAQKNTDANDASFHSLKNQIRLNYIPVSMPQNSFNAFDKTMGLAGLHYLVPISKNIYGGINMHAALFGDQGGLFTLGVALGYQQKIVSNLFFDSNINFGGGGGYRLLINKGAYINPNIGLSYHFPKFNIGLQYSHFNFYTGIVKSNTASIFAEIPINVNVGSYKSAHQKHRPTVNSPWYSAFHKNGFVLRSDQFYPIGNSRKDAAENSELIENTILHLIGFEYQRYINHNTFAFVHTDAIYKGLTAGFMDLFGGIGYEPIQTKRFSFFTKFAFGAAGGRIQQEGGATIYPSFGLEYKMTPSVSLQTHGGYLRAIDGDFEAYTFGAGLKINAYTGGFYNPDNHKRAYQLKSNGIRLSLQHQTYFNLKRFDREPLDLHLLAIQLNYDLNQYFYLAGQASFAYEATFSGNDAKSELGAGGYADGMVGFGFYSPIFAKQKIQFFTEFLVGAGGGAGIDTKEGIIGKAKVGAYYHINNTFSVLASAGKVISPTRSINSNNVNIGLSVNFSSLKSIFKINKKEMNNGLYAKFNTSKGAILVNLEFEKTPGTVGNFVALTEGNMENDVKPQGTRYYDGLTFHRVIPDFMIQGGCPLGTGTGSPGYSFADEIVAELKHDTPGKLSMANAGPGTNGSQFFITHTATPWLDGKHTVFGNVVEGQDIVDAVAQGDIIESLEIIRVGEAAEKFNAVEAFRTFEGAREANLKAEAEARELELEKLAAGYEKTASGLRYQIIQKGNSGKKATKGQQVSVHYKGQLPDGTVFDSSYKRNEPIEFAVGVGQVIKGWDEGILLLEVGDKARMVIPSDLAYGTAGAGGVIPPNATLVFDVELVKVK